MRAAVEIYKPNRDHGTVNTYLLARHKLRASSGDAVWRILLYFRTTQCRRNRQIVPPVTKLLFRLEKNNAVTSLFEKKIIVFTRLFCLRFTSADVARLGIILRNTSLKIRLRRIKRRVQRITGNR